jgi:hypothetical protein
MLMKVRMRVRMLKRRFWSKDGWCVVVDVVGFGIGEAEVGYSVVAFPNGKGGIGTISTTGFVK